MARKSLTYSTYLAVDELLALQRHRSEGPEHDETLFIVIHQVYELWFKQLLHEGAHLQERLEAGDAPSALHTFRRMLTILKTIVAQVDVLETMTPLSFASFRTRLDSASGFQSWQFRLLEALLGRRDEGVLRDHEEGSEGRARLSEAMRQPALWDSFLAYLATSGHPVPAEALARDRRLAPAPDPAVQDVLIAVYRGDAIAAMVCERMVDLDEGVQEWRYRHVKMVERTIGSAQGTGGSSGAEYLRSTLFRPAFPDLWAIRARL